MRIPASIATALILPAAVVWQMSTRAQSPDVFAWKPAPGMELAAKSSDDDDEPAPKRSHSSTVKKATDNDESGKASDAQSGTKKKKKKTKVDDDAASETTPSNAKKSGVSDEDSPPPKLKKAPKPDGASVSQEKSKKDDSTTAKDTKDTTERVPADGSKHAPNASVEPDAITGFAGQPERIQRLITSALDLTKQNLTYAYGSAEPSNGGMDCSGTIYFLLHSQGFQDVPRDSSGQYEWARKHGQFFAVVSTKSDSFEFKDLMPGDLMFWTGTYQVERDIPISHVMLYLGIEKRTGNRIMFGASDGRSYNGLQRWGVSVFDFKMPKIDASNQDKRRVDFVGYARIPGLRDAADAHREALADAEEKIPKDKDETAKKTVEKNADDSTPPPKKKSGAKKSVVKKRASSDSADL